MNSDNALWQGRWDGDQENCQRIFQKVQLVTDYDTIHPNDFALHGFAVDEGVRRNKGRVGAKDAPDVIRRNMSNFPVQSSEFRLLDFGNVFCLNQNLEAAQKDLSERVSLALKNEAKSIVFGGGHEVTYAHYTGVKMAFPDQKIGIINFDAHFDNREPEPGVGASSGTGFWQIAQEGEIHSLHIGIQKNSNTKKLFETAEQFQMQYLLSDEIYFENLSYLKSRMDALFQKVDKVYVTICMDVFNASIAPGVSAAAYNGIFADATFMACFRHILHHNKTIALDVAEVNPQYDIQDRTARLAASLVNEWFM
ncbi:MAG: formimidoylglutamase [Bacteroidetes bacterium]|nr:formimidoylglutamase [Bacteroidota bacterium]